MHAAPCHWSDQVRSEQGDDIEIGDFAGSAKREKHHDNTYENLRNQHKYTCLSYIVYIYI